MSSKAYVAFVRVRRVGGGKGGKRPALGLTIPAFVCRDLCLEIGDVVLIRVERVEKIDYNGIWKGFNKVVLNKESRAKTRST